MSLLGHITVKDTPVFTCDEPIMERKRVTKMFSTAL